ncbi:MAG: hypothetical protein ABIJ57_01065 [Pseudomonadota bacterium]
MTLSYEEIGQTIGRLVDKKNRAYGDSFHRSGEIIKPMLIRDSSEGNQPLPGG